jgi:hypothetical protein
MMNWPLHRQSGTDYAEDNIMTIVLTGAFQLRIITDGRVGRPRVRFDRFVALGSKRHRQRSQHGTALLWPGPPGSLFGLINFSSVASQGGDEQIICVCCNRTECLRTVTAGLGVRIVLMTGIISESSTTVRARTDILAFRMRHQQRTPHNAF